ncbi:hypothetical protein IGI04_015861, partial [Brassica rapa subsp. trilocularis]
HYSSLSSPPEIDIVFSLTLNCSSPRYYFTDRRIGTGKAFFSSYSGKGDSGTLTILLHICAVDRPSPSPELHSICIWNSLANSNLSSEEIIRRVVERKVVVNIVSAKSVDQLGQAYVRSLISTDEVESGGYPGDPRGQSSANPSGAPHGGESFHVDVETLLRRAAEVYEDKVIAMFEGYILREFDKIKQLLKSGPRGADMGATYGFSPARHSSPFRGQNDDFNYTEVNPDRHTTPSGVPQSTPRDGEDVAATETASGGLGQNLDEGEMGEGLSPGKQTESTHGAELRAQTGVHHGGDADTGNVEVGEQGGDADIGHDPINVENPSPSVNVAAPDSSDAANPPSRVDVDEVNVSSERRVDDPVSGVVNKIISEAGIDKNPVRPSAGSGTDVPQTSSDVNPEKVGLDGVHDDRGDATVANKGEDADEDDVTITKVQAGDKNTDAAVVKLMVADVLVDVAAEPSNPKPRSSRKTHLHRWLLPIYSANPSCKRGLHEDNGGGKSGNNELTVLPLSFRSNAPSLGSISSIASLDDLFNCTGVCSYEAVDRVVGWIRKRRDSNPSSKFDFIPPTFFIDLIRSYPAFEAMQDKSAFTFPVSLRSQFMHRPQWFTQVDFLYSMILVKDRHWVGIIVDLPMWAIYVVDANQTCPPISVLKDVVNPISIMMPHMVSRFCLTSRARELKYLPFPISRLDIPVLLEHPGYAAVVALIMLEIAAVGKPLLDLALTDEEVRVAAENYAISTLCMFKVVPPNPAV